MTAALDYLNTVRMMLVQAQDANAEAIAEAARLMARCIAGGGVVHTFGTGHSYILAEEVFGRAGGLVAVSAILYPPLMLHRGIFVSSQAERETGLAARVLERAGIRAGDVLIIISNSGRNAVPIEAALWAKQRGVPVIALVSLTHSRSVEARHQSGKRLFELAGVVLDNCGVPGDAVMTVKGAPDAVGATSTVIGAALLEAVVVQTVADLVALGQEPPIFVSANLDGSDQHNRKLAMEYNERVPGLVGPLFPETVIRSLIGEQEDIC